MPFHSYLHEIGLNYRKQSPELSLSYELSVKYSPWANQPLWLNVLISKMRVVEVILDLKFYITSLVLFKSPISIASCFNSDVFIFLKFTYCSQAL